MKREQFLRDFLGALGARDVVFSDVRSDVICGDVVYDPDDPEETQAFCWHVREVDVPNDAVRSLAALIRRKRLLDIDQLTVTRDELHELYDQATGSPTSSEQFANILEALESVEVPMVDEGTETDAYFIHE